MVEVFHDALEAGPPAAQHTNRLMLLLRFGAFVLDAMACTSFDLMLWVLDRVGADRRRTGIMLFRLVLLLAAFAGVFIGGAYLYSLVSTTALTSALWALVTPTVPEPDTGLSIVPRVPRAALIHEGIHYEVVPQNQSSITEADIVTALFLSNNESVPATMATLQTDSLPSLDTTTASNTTTTTSAPSTTTSGVLVAQRGDQNFVATQEELLAYEGVSQEQEQEQEQEQIDGQVDQSDPWMTGAEEPSGAQPTWQPTDTTPRVGETAYMSCPLRSADMCDFCSLVENNKWLLPGSYLIFGCLCYIIFGCFCLSPWKCIQLLMVPLDRLQAIPEAWQVVWHQAAAPQGIPVALDINHAANDNYDFDVVHIDMDLAGVAVGAPAAPLGMQQAEGVLPVLMAGEAAGADNDQEAAGSG